jgi:hypothetical protein
VIRFENLYPQEPAARMGPQSPRRVRPDASTSGREDAPPPPPLSLGGGAVREALRAAVLTGSVIAGGFLVILALVLIAGAS